MGIYVYDKRFPDTVIGKAVTINYQTQTAVVATDRGCSVLPLNMIIMNGGYGK